MLYLGDNKLLIMRILTILSICAVFFSCSTPLQLLEEGKIDKAFRIAAKKVKSGKNTSENRLVLIKSANKLIQNELYNNLHLTQSKKVQDWVKAQNNYFKTLKDIVVANDLVEGQLQNSYDQLCNQKIELDFKIVNYFYQNGDKLLATHYDQLSKHHAREAYYQYQESLAFGGDRFFQDIEDKMEECIVEGRIFFVSHNFNPTTDLFFQPLPEDAKYEPDCSISASFGPRSFSYSSHSTSSDYSKEVEVGKKSEIDTSGKLIYKSILKTICATVRITKTTITASSNTSIYSDDITGYCFKEDKFFRSCASDSYTVVDISGDRRAISGAIPCNTGSEFAIRRSLESDLDRAIDSELYFW